MEDNKVICPVCDHVITDFEEGVSDPCEHVALTYVDMLNGEFVHVGDKGIEEELLSKYEQLMDTEAEENLAELMESYAEEHEGFEIVELTTSGLSCGPVSSTEYHLIKTK